MHLLIARLYHLRHLLPTSNRDILVYYNDISEQYVQNCECTFPTGHSLLQGTSLNNPINLHHQKLESLRYSFAADSICVITLQISEHCFIRKPKHANPLDAEPETNFNAKWPFRVIQGHLFRCQ